VVKRLVLGLCGLLLLASPAGAQPFAGSPSPANVAHSFRALVQTADETVLVSWAEPGRYAERRGTSRDRRPFLAERGGVTYVGRAPDFPGAVTRRTFVARPDAFSSLERFVEPVDFVLAQARRGTRTLVATTAGGKAAWRTSYALRANDCAGLRAGRATLWLARSTLLPLRLEERRGGRTTVSRFDLRSVNASLPASDFRTPLLGARPFREDQGFRRTSPAAAGAQLSYAPELPALLPTGFVRSLTGWAPRSARTGAEGSNPAKPELFAAVYRRGFERIDVSQRLAGTGGFPADPFGGECTFQFEEAATVRGVSARYGAGPSTPPHLYWREGRVLYTVSGPFPKADLVAIANSLAPVP